MMTIGSIVLVLLALLGAPLFLIISGMALVGFWVEGRPPADVTGDIYKVIAMDTLITIPLFTFAGYMLAESGAPRRLVAFAKALVGWLPGGMALVTLVACAFFTTFTGASGITIVALGGLMLPILLQQKYPRDFSLGLVTSSGSRGLIFPPSLPVIIYGYVATMTMAKVGTGSGTVEITKLYLAGMVPGLIGLAVIAFWCVRVGIVAKVPRADFDLKAAAKALWGALPEVLLPVWLIALILTGVLKVPEAAAMAALYVLIVEVVIYRDIHPIRDLPRITKESMVLCGAILVIIGSSMGMTNYLVQKEVPQLIVETISAYITSKWVFLFALNVVLLVVGCMMEMFSAIVIVVPLIVPLAIKFQVDPYHLAIIFLVNLEVGFTTPPVGMNLFISSFRFRQPIVRLYRAALPFLVLALLALLTITYVEPLSTFTLPPKERDDGAEVTPDPKDKGEDVNDLLKQVDQEEKGQKKAEPKKTGDDDDEEIDDLLKEVDEEEKGGAAKKAEPKKSALQPHPADQRAGPKTQEDEDKEAEDLLKEIDEE